jgi:hypothetical protein
MSRSMPLLFRSPDGDDANGNSASVTGKMRKSETWIGMVSMRAFEQKLPVVRGGLRASTGVVTGRGAGKAVVGLVSPGAVDG